MIKHNNSFGWLLATWLVLSSSITAAAQSEAQPASQGFQSPYRMSATFNSGYSGSGYQTSRLNTSSTMQPASKSVTPAYTKRSAFDMDFGEGVRTNSLFQSVTADEMLEDYTKEYGGALKAPRKVWSWSEPTDNPVGTVDNPTPVGEPLILLVMAMAGAIAVYLRNRRRSSEPTQDEMILSGNE